MLIYPLYITAYLNYNNKQTTNFQAKEESAWKIAEMIVRDVTSLTLGASDLPS